MFVFAKRMLFVVFTIGLLFPEKGNAQDVLTEMYNNSTVMGYVENKSAYRLKSPNRFSKFQNIINLELESFIGDNVRVYSRDRLEYDAVYDFDDYYADASHREYQFNGNFGGIVKELYLEGYWGANTLRLGKQQVVWGEATGLKITDIVNPMDLREFILDDFLDSRIGLWMLRFNRIFGASELTAVIIPDFEGNKSAVSGSEWGMSLPSYLNGFYPIVHETKRPADNLKNSDVGFRLNSIVNSWDISLYYFYSWDDDSTFHTYTSGFVKNIYPEHHRLHTVGGTFNYAFDKFVFSGELAVYFNKHYQTSDSLVADAVVKKNYVHYMLGADYILNSSVNLSAQLVQKVILGNTRNLRSDAVDTTLTFMVQTDFLNETLKPDIFFIYGANNGEWLVRPKVSYDWNDNINVSAGMDILEGPTTDALLGQFRRNDRLFTEIKYSF